LSLFQGIDIALFKVPTPHIRGKNELDEQIHSMQALTESYIFCQGSAGPN
jgi:hypothetical protein